MAWEGGGPFKRMTPTRWRALYGVGLVLIVGGWCLVGYGVLTSDPPPRTRSYRRARRRYEYRFMNLPAISGLLIAGLGHTLERGSSGRWHA